ncbi:RNA polymerase sigma factor [Streptomyces sp. NRRL B-24085]|uniref:RNA polymerase sigma factor n=1 Tax=Streptomyces sp. NRRL B-24085 TaxID=1709476 RepID=UPI000AA379FB|nr:sigma-70 family RNA polymerase sigma factor [Streptomyces sp. NRRL B-24085]
MVAGEAAAESSAPAEGELSAAVRVDLGQRLFDYYDTFMAQEPQFLRHTWKGRLSEQACEDIAQEAFMRVAGKVAAEELGPGVKIGAYLRTASWNLALDTLRAQRRTDLVEDTASVAAADRRSEDMDPLRELVRPAIEAMPLSRRRTVVRLQSLGLDDAQISAVLGIARDRIHRDRYAAVSELRNELGTFIRDGHRKTPRTEKDR